MSRKVTLTVPVDIVVRDRDVHVLALVKKRSGASSHGVSASIRSFADELDTYCVTKSGDGVIEAARRAGLIS